MTVHTYNVSSQVVTDIRMLPWNYDPEQMALQQDTLYVCEYRKLREFDFHLAMAPLICVLERDSAVWDVFFSGRTVVTVSGGTVQDVLITLIDVVYDFGSGSSRMTEISRLLTGCRDMRELITAGYEILGNPLILTDENQQIVAYTDVETVSAGTYREIVSLGHLPVGHPLPSESQEYWEPVDYPFYEDGSGDLPAILCKRLTVGGRTLGYLHVLQFNRDFTGADGAAAELLGNLLAIALWNRPDNRGASRYRQTESFLRDILDNGKDEEYIERQQQNLGLKLKPYLYTATVNARRMDLVPRVSFYELAHQMADLLSGCYGFLYRNAAFLLIHTEDEISDFSAYFEPVMPLLQKHGLTVGVSNVFESLAQIREHGFQSRKAQQLGLRLRPESSVFLYHDLSIYYMMELCLKNERLDALCLPEVKKLMEHSPKDGGELIQTLQTYLRCGRSKSQTARELFVHLNTVKYRLAQIQEIMGIDLDNDDNALKIMLSFKMLEYTESFRGYETMNR